jgi:hypothetical protein
VFEWRVQVTCPVRLLEGAGAGSGVREQHRGFYVWTSQRSAVDAFDEALRVVESWPSGTAVLDVEPMGMYLPLQVAHR